MKNFKIKKIKNFEQFRGLCKEYIPLDNLVFKCFFSTDFDRYTCILRGSEQASITYYSYRGKDKCDFQRDKDAKSEEMSLFEGLEKLKEEYSKR